jgi:DNA polymerase V
MRVAGFPSPADEYGLVSLSLTELMIPRPTSTFFIRVVEDLAPNIKRQDILVVDRSLKITEGCLALIVNQGELCLRRALQKNSEWWLISLTQGAPLRLGEDEEAILWGVVTYVIHQTLK